MKNFRSRQAHCTICGKPYITTGNNAKYCADCRVEVQRINAREYMRKKKKRHGKKSENSHASICWGCANAVPDPLRGTGCSWAKEFIPVEGWEAKEKGNSYNVWHCPEFKGG